MSVQVQKNSSNEDSESIIKATRGIALSMAAISIALAALCLALLSFANTQSHPNDVFYNTALPLILVFLGTTFVLVAALDVDWVVDQFQDSDWKTILGKKEADPTHLDQFSVRLALFNRGYFLMCICVAGLSFMILLQGLYKLAPVDTALFRFSLIVSILWSLYIIFQMMTKKAGRFAFALIALGMVLGSVLVDVLT